MTDYATFPQLLDYCTRSANPVGHLVLYLGRVVQPRERPALRPDLHRRCNWPTSGRTSPGTSRSAGSTSRARTASGSAIPTPTSSRAGSPPSSPPCWNSRSSAPATCSSAGGPLVARMPRALAVDVDLFSRGGLAILDRIETQGFDVLPVAPEAEQARRRSGCSPGRSWAGRVPSGRRSPRSSTGRSARGRARDRRARRQLSILRRDLAARGEELLLQLPAPPPGASAVDVRPVRLHAAHRRPGRRARPRRGEARGARRLAGRPRRAPWPAAPRPGPACPPWPTRSIGTRSPRGTSTRSSTA